MTFEGLDATATLGPLVHLSLARRAQLPHLDSPIQTTTDKILAAGRKSNTIDTVLVAIGAFQALDEVTRLDVPNADALVQRSGGD